MGFLEKFDQINRVIDSAIDIGNDYQELRSSGHVMKEELKSYTNGRRKEELKIVDEIHKKDARLIKWAMVVWAILVFGTVALCIIGNDIVLRILCL